MGDPYQLSSFNPVDYIYLNPELSNVITVEQAYISYETYGSNDGLLSVLNLPTTFDPKIYYLMNSNAILNSTTIDSNIVNSLLPVDMARICSIHYLREGTSNSVFEISPWFNTYMYRAFNQVTNIMTDEQLYVDYATRTIEGQVVIGTFEDFRVLNENYRQASLHVRSNLEVNGTAFISGLVAITDLEVEGQMRVKGDSTFSNLTSTSLLTASNVHIIGDTTVDGNIVNMNADILSSRRMQIINQTTERPGLLVSQYYGNDVLAAFYENDEPVMVLRESGNVGILTDQPLDTLDVRGTIRCRDITLSNPNGITTIINDPFGMMAITAPRGISVTDTFNNHLIAIDATTGYVSIGSDINATNFTVQGTANITSDTHIVGNLTVDGYTVSQYLDIYAQGILTVDQTVTFNSNAFIMSDVTMSNTLDVTGKITGLSGANITGAVIMGNQLTTTGYVGIGYEMNSGVTPAAFLTMNTAPAIDAIVGDSNLNVDVIWFDAAGATKTALTQNQAVIHTSPGGVQHITPSTLITGTLTVNSAVTLNSNLTLNNSTSRWLDGSVLLSNASQTIDGGFLKVSSDITGYSNLFISSNITAGGNFTLTGVATILSNLDVTSSIRARSNVVIDGYTNIRNAAQITSNVVIGGTMSVSKNVFLNNNLEVFGNTYVDTTLYVTGNSVLSSNLRVKETTQLDTTLTVNSNTLLKANLQVQGPTQLDTTLNVYGSTISQSNLRVIGSTRLCSNLVTDGNVLLNSGLEVVGSTQLDSTLSVTGASTLTGFLRTYSGARIDGALDVYGMSRLWGNFAVNGSTTVRDITVQNPATFNSTVNVQGSTTLGSTQFNSNIRVQGTATMDGSVIFNGQTSLSNLNVQGPVSFTSNLDVWGQTVLHSGLDVALATYCYQDLFVSLDIICDQAVLVRHGGVIIQTTCEVHGNTTLNTMTANGNSTFNSNAIFNENVSVASNLTAANLNITDLVNLYGPVYSSNNAVFNSNVNILGELTCYSDAYLENLHVNGSFNVIGAISFNGNNNINGDLFVDGNCSVHSNQDILGSLSVLGTTSLANLVIGSNLAVTGPTALSSTLAVSGATSLNSNLTVTGPAELSSTLAVSGATSLSSNLAVTGPAELSSTLAVSGATSLSSNLAVTGPTTLSSTLAVSGATSLNSTLGVTGPTALSSTLAVSGATSLSSTLGVTGDTTINSNLNVSGDATVNGTVSANTFMTSSDARIKRDIRDATTDELVEYIEKINIKAYKLLDEEHEQYGIIGQQAEKVHPSLTTRCRKIVPAIGVTWVWDVETSEVIINEIDANSFAAGGPICTSDEFEFALDDTMDRITLSVERVKGAWRGEWKGRTPPVRMTGRVISDFITVNTSQMIHALVACVQDLLKNRN